MDILQNIDGGSVVIVVICCALLCGVGVVLLLVTQLIGSVFDVIGSVVGIFSGVVSGGPVSWCGCLALIAGIVICGGLALLLAQALSSCGTANAVNFCRLLGQ